MEQKVKEIQKLIDEKFGDRSYNIVHGYNMITMSTVFIISTFSQGYTVQIPIGARARLLIDKDTPSSVFNFIVSPIILMIHSLKQSDGPSMVVNNYIQVRGTNG